MIPLILYMGSSLLTLTVIIVGAIHTHIYLLSTGQVSNEYPYSMETSLDMFLIHILRSLKLALISCGSIPLSYVSLNSSTTHVVVFPPIYFINTSEKLVLLGCYH